MDFFRIILALFTVFGLLGSLYFVSNRAKTRAPRLLASAREICSGRFRVAAKRDGVADFEILKRLNLTTTHQLHLVKTAQTVFVLCTHPHGCTLLSAEDSGALATNHIASSSNLERYAS